MKAELRPLKLLFFIIFGLILMFPAMAQSPQMTGQASSQQQMTGQELSQQIWQFHEELREAIQKGDKAKG